MVNSDSCTATFTQIAGVEALTGDQAAADAMIQEFRRRRDLIVHGLTGWQASPVQCRGGFLCVSRYTGNRSFVARGGDSLLYDGGVASLAGTSFGANGEGFVRFSYANSYTNIENALIAIETVIKRTTLFRTARDLSSLRSSRLSPRLDRQSEGRAAYRSQ